MTTDHPTSLTRGFVAWAVMRAVSALPGGIITKLGGGLVHVCTTRRSILTGAGDGHGTGTTTR